MNVKNLIDNISKEFKLNETAIGQSLMGGVQALREQQKENSIIMPCLICGKGNLVIKFSKKTRRYFVACDKYPECKSTYSLPPNSLIKRTEKLSSEGLPILIALRKGKRPWEFTFNPNYKKETKDSTSV
jgi:DNA topoisomerase-1